MNVTALIKLVRDGLTEAGHVKTPVVAPGTPASVIPCVVMRPGYDELENASRTLRYGFDVTVLVPRSSQPEQYELLTDLVAIVVRSIRADVRFDGPIRFDPYGGEGIGEPPALARIIPISFASDVDLC